MRFSGVCCDGDKNLFALLILFALWIFSSFVSFAATAVEAEQPSAELSIKPLTCIVKVAGDHCQMTVTVTWKTSQPFSGCLFQEEHNLACWQKQDHVKEQLTVSLAKDMVFALKNQQGLVIANQSIKVNASTSTQYRRRLRAQWSLF